MTSVKGSQSMWITWKEKYPKYFWAFALCWALKGLRCLPSRPVDRSDTYLSDDKTMCCLIAGHTGRTMFWGDWGKLKWEHNIWPGFKTMRSQVEKWGKSWTFESAWHTQWPASGDVAVWGEREKWKLRFESTIGTPSEGPHIHTEMSR